METSNPIVTTGKDLTAPFSTTSPTTMELNMQRSRPTSNSNTGSSAHDNIQSDNVPLYPSKKPQIFEIMQTKLGLNSIVIMFMVKGALTVAITTAMFQAHSVAKHFLNLGYLMIVVGILSVPMLPRGKFLMNISVSVLLTCFACGMVVLGQWAGIKARQHSIPPNATAEVANGYNSSAAAVNAIFLIFNTFLINTFRAFRPAFNVPSIQYTIFVTVGFVYGLQEITVAGSHRFVKELLYSFLTGQAVATGVSLFIIPVSSRKVFFGEATGLLQNFRGLLKIQLAFIEALEHSETCEPVIPKGMTESTGTDDVQRTDEYVKNRQLYSQRSSALKSSSTALLALGARMHGDVTFAERETAYGYLGGRDIRDLHQLLRAVLIPTSSLSTVGDIAERISRRWNAEKASSPQQMSDRDDLLEFTLEDRENERNEWRELTRDLHESWGTTVQVLDESVAHIMVLLKLVPDPKSKKRTMTKTEKNGTVPSGDVEAGSSGLVVGEVGFGNFLEEQIQKLCEQRASQLQDWASGRDLSSVFHSANNPYHISKTQQPNHATEDPRSAREMRAAQKLQLILYMEYLLFSTARGVLSLVRFMESKVENGTMNKKRFIVPSWKTIKQWINSIINGDDAPPEIQEHENLKDTIHTIYLGDCLKEPKDPEHLPPKNIGQVLGNYMRKIPEFFGSAPVKFGFRVTIAVMSIGIIAFLKNTHAFFIAQRVVWALVMVAIGMNPTAGSAVFNLLGNLTATLVAMIFSFINWYIVDGKTAGIIVFLSLFMMVYFYFAATYPRFLVPIAAGAITQVLIIGYELQVRVIGYKTAVSTGQEFYPIYEIAPFRLLTVAGGVIIAYFWTIFPVPITERSVLRRALGDSLFLVARYLSVVSSTIDQRLMYDEEDVHLISRATQKLTEERQKILDQLIALLGSMRQNLSFISWEPRLGGDFPVQTYTALVNEVQRMVNYLTVAAYASSAFEEARSDPKPSEWLTEFSRTRSVTDRKSHEVTSLLALLSASIKNRQPLPPYLSMPPTFNISNQANRSSLDILTLKDINEPGYRAFAVIEVASSCLIESTENIVKLVKDLVGELDFSFQVIKTLKAKGK